MFLRRVHAKLPNRSSSSSLSPKSERYVLFKLKRYFVIVLRNYKPANNDYEIMLIKQFNCHSPSINPKLIMYWLIPMILMNVMISIFWIIHLLTVVMHDIFMKSLIWLSWTSTMMWIRINRYHGLSATIQIENKRFIILFTNIIWNTSFSIDLILEKMSSTIKNQTSKFSFYAWKCFYHYSLRIIERCSEENKEISKILPLFVYNLFTTRWHRWFQRISLRLCESIYEH